MVITETHRLPLLSFTIRIWFKNDRLLTGIEQKTITLQGESQESVEDRVATLYPHAIHWDVK